MTRDLDAPSGHTGTSGSSRAAAPGRRLVVLRHGRTEWNAVGRAQGHANISLDDVGREQAEAVAPYLASLEPAALWTSDLARARETCAFVEKETGLSAVEDVRLREFDVGAAPGADDAGVRRALPRTSTPPGSTASGFRLEGAEVDHEVADADGCRRCARPCSRSRAGETVVVVTHGASLKIGLVALLGWPLETATTLQGIDNCAWVTVEELDLDGRLRMSGYNESVRPGHDAPPGCRTRADPETGVTSGPAPRGAPDFASATGVG